MKWLIYSKLGSKHVIITLQRSKGVLVSYLMHHISYIFSLLLASPLSWFPPGGGGGGGWLSEVILLLVFIVQNLKGFREDLK